MPRLTGPDEGSRFVYRLNGNAMMPAVGASAVFYTDAAGTTLADIRDANGNAVASTLTVDTYSRLPLFQLPDGVDTVYVSVAHGPLTPVYARTDDRLDALVAGAAAEVTARAAADAAALVAANGTYRRKGAAYLDLRDYGAVADCNRTGSTAGATDNTSALQTAITAAYNAGGGTIYVPDPGNGKCYGLFGALTGASPYSQAQVLIPFAAMTTGTVTIELVGDHPYASSPSTPAGGFAAPASKTGSMFRTTATANGSGFGSIIDVANSNSGTGNIHFITRGITYRLPDNPGVSGIRGIWFSAMECHDTLVDTPSATGSIVQPTNVNQAGIWFPQTDLQGPAVANRFCVIGSYVGFFHSEHFSGDAIEIFACAVAHRVGIGYHSAHIGRIGYWWCPISIQAEPSWNGATSPAIVPLTMSHLDFEDAPTSGTYSAMWWAATYHVDDPHDGLVLNARYNRIEATVGRINNSLGRNGAAKVSLTPLIAPASTIARNEYTGGGIALSSTTFANVGQPSDLVVAADAGDWIELGLSCRPDAGAGDVAFDMVTMVGATPTNYISTGNGTPSAQGVDAWFAQAAAGGGGPQLYTGAGGTMLYQVRAGDVSGGTVTFRLRYRLLSGTRTLDASVDDRLVTFAINRRRGF